MGEERAGGPDAVPGVAELRMEGFEPVEEYTGVLLLAEMWPGGLDPARDVRRHVEVAGASRRGV